MKLTVSPQRVSALLFQVGFRALVVRLLSFKGVVQLTQYSYWFHRVKYHLNKILY